MSKDRIFVRTLAFVFALLPWSAFASLHADLGPLEGVFVGFAAFLGFGSIALLVAAYLFWKRGQSGWLFACVAITAIPSALSRLLIMANPSSPMLSFTFFWQFAPLLYWVILGIAVFAKPSKIGR